MLQLGDDENELSVKNENNQDKCRRHADEFEFSVKSENKHAIARVIAHWRNAQGTK